jgi:D-alanyl-D-alanine carboxypeptidase/D-alanyl-D-alanine-endopeptidase (penicillin-binding protein 4)
MSFTIARLLSITSFLVGVLGFPDMAQPSLDLEHRTAAAPPDNKLKQSTATLCPAQLTGTVNQIINQAGLGRSRWGILIQTQAPVPANRKTLVTRNAQTLLIPASSNKLLTTAAALQQLGAGYTIRTSVYGAPAQVNLNVLRVIGRGDPSLTPVQLKALAQQLKQRGVSRVEMLVGNDMYFRGAIINPNWDPDDTLAGYGAAINSLIVNQNSVGLTLFPQQVGQPLRVQWDDPSDASQWRISNRSTTVGAQSSEFLDVVRDRTASVIYIEGQLRAGSASEPVAASVRDPASNFLFKFRTALSGSGIAVSKTLLTTFPPFPSESELASIQSPPLSVLIKETNQESNNLYAEVLLKTLGAARSPSSSNATASGITAVRDSLAALGVNPNGIRQTDGSGLAGNNQVTAEALAQTLQAMAAGANAQVYRDSLPVAGVSGTLKDRFRNTPAQGRVAAKTGTISGVVALAGYASPANHPPLVFSLIVNDSSVSASRVRSAIDAIVLQLMRLRNC